MKPDRTKGTGIQLGAGADCLLGPGPLDVQFGQLLETIWACERQWTIDDHIDAAIKYGR